MKIAGMIMIILFSFSLGLMAVNKKKLQIEYADALVYMGNLILIMLNSTMPETYEIRHNLENDSRLSKYDFSENNLIRFLNKNDVSRVQNLLYAIGKYDVDSQILITQEFIGYFKLLKQQYQDYYNNHHRLYIALGLFGGIIVSVLLI